MIDMKPTITAALRGSAIIAELIGRDCIGLVKVYPETVPSDDNYKKNPVTEPYITYIELTNFEANHADDDEFQSEIHFQIDIWTKGNTGPIAAEVDRVMKSLGFIRTGSADQYEQDTKTYHKVLRFKKIMEV